MSVCRVVAAMLGMFACTGAIHSFADYSIRVINGSTATSGTYPFIASVSPDGSGDGGCGGSLINAEWVVTAAHCFLNEVGNSVDMSLATRATVTLASDTLNPVSSNAEVFTVSQLVIHPGYNPDTATSPNNNDHDIALLKLSGRSSQAVVRLQAATATLPVGTSAIIMGWGATAIGANNESVNPSNTLLEATQLIVDNTTCNAAYGGSITDNMLCAGGLSPGDTTDTCQGDSGGPLVINDNGTFVQVGVVSFGGTETGPACGDPNAPGVYARISQYNSFIQEQIPDIQFANLGGSTDPSDCAGTLIDPSSLELTLSCVVLDDAVFSTTLIWNDPSQLAWEWNNEIGATTCAASHASCVRPDSNLGLTMTGIVFGGSSHTLRLDFDQTSGETLRWLYNTHFVE